jgi:protein-S-isoprenylcysteine O-methyltransferase Ste14
MSTTTTPDRNSTRGRGIPRWVLVILALFVWLVGFPLAHGIVPWALSWLAPRFGWTAGYPGTWNWLGLILIAAGTAVLIWIFASGLARARELPERMQRLGPPFLMTTGPYAFTRNPMYVAELSLWLGWATLFGSLVTLLGLVVLTVVIILILPWEERGLERQFGETYRLYQARVPRWLGRIGR